MSQENGGPPTGAARGSDRFIMDRSRPAAAQIYEHLHQRIVELDLQPGQALSRVALCEQYKVSQTPIREAILKLETLGLVDVFRQSRTIVAVIDIEAAREAQFLRTALELEVCREIALRRDPSLLADARDLLARQAHALRARDLLSFHRLDRAFHEALHQVTGRHGLWQLINERSGHVDRLRKLYLPSAGKAATILADHEAMVAAIETGEPDIVQAAVRSHLGGTLRALPQIIAQYPAYFDGEAATRV
ncbi:MAG: GntR family transcriptional regulator [Burkholderiaceae bacterium]